MNKHLPRNLVERFPAYRERLVELLASNDRFGEIWENYMQCIAVLHRLTQEKVADLERIKEYCELIAELEQEACQFLQERDS